MQHSRWRASPPVPLGCSFQNKSKCLETTIHYIFISDLPYKPLRTKRSEERGKDSHVFSRERGEEFEMSDLKLFMKLLGNKSTVTRRNNSQGSNITLIIPFVCFFTVLILACMMKTISVWFNRTWPAQAIPRIKITEPSSCFGTYYYEDVFVKDASYDYLSPNKIYL